MGIRAIIWDMGGVLVRTEDYSSRDALARRLGMTREDLEHLVFSAESGEGAQRGEITAEQHWENLGGSMGLNPQEREAFIRDFFDGDRLDIQLVDYIRGLRLEYRTGLLSNGFSNLRYFLTQDWQIDDAFDELVISAEVGMTKPDAPIYRLALERLGVEPHEAVFIDDFKRNVKGARAVSMHAIHFQDPDQAITELEQILKGNQK